jgi:putative nucleotidyltransferase with HDIG domain
MSVFKKYQQLESFFIEYSNEFLCISDVVTKAVNLKISHTFRVCKEMEDLCRVLKLTDENMYANLIVALLHDVGRFEQFKKFNTFSDKHSLNHASLAVEIIIEKKLLNSLSDHLQQLILLAIQNHNKMNLPVSLNGEEFLFCSLIRDTDKLDIYRVTTEHYTRADEDLKKIIDIGIEGVADISEEIVECIINKQNIDYGKLKNLNEFKMAQIGWIFDLNYPQSVALIKKRGYYDTLKSHLPQNEKTLKAFAVVDKYILEKMTSLE